VLYTISVIYYYTNHQLLHAHASGLIGPSSESTTGCFKRLSNTLCLVYRTSKNCSR